jgi:hypothetical protein
MGPLKARRSVGQCPRALSDVPLFPRWTNTVFAAGGVLLVVAPAAALGGLMVYVRTPFHTSQGFPIEQPIQFDHRHHVADDGIDCRYCHSSVERSSTAGIPSTSVCMNCHSQIWNRAPLLERVRESYFGGRSLEFVRVNQVPDFVFFNHSIHVNKGVGCASCHGRVDRMPQMLQAQSLTMEWCLDCHRDPGPHLRPLDQVTNMKWSPSTDRAVLGSKLRSLYDVESKTDCYTCHR